MTRVAVTGGAGFLGWHLRVLACTRDAVEVVILPRDICRDSVALANELSRVDRVVHLAGVNRGSDEEVRSGNVVAAQELAEGLRRAQRPPAIAFANSVQCGNGTTYGDAKEEAAAILRDATESCSVDFADLRLPNIFGEHGRPRYNSVVATFAHQLANGERPVVIDDRQLELVHAQVAAASLLDAPGGTNPLPLKGRALAVSQLLASMGELARRYREGEIPSLPDVFSVDLFNTYRSFCDPRAPFELHKHEDQRGHLVETMKVHGGTGQTFFSRSCVGVTRGQHFHLRKVERFVVVEGEAVIRLRRKFFNEVVEHRVSGERPVAVDMQTMWVHSITNVGTSPLLTLFWSHDLFDAFSPDTYPEEV